MTVEYHFSTMTNMDVDESPVYVSRNRSFKAATVCLGLLCLLLLVGLIVQTIHYQQVTQDHQNNMTAMNTDKENYSSRRSDQIQTSYNSLLEERDNLQNKFNNVTRSREQLQLSYNELIQKVEGLQERYNSSSSEKDKIASSHQNLTMEMQKLQKQRDYLSRRRDQIQTDYNSLLEEKNKLASGNQNLMMEMKKLQETYNIVKKSENELQASYQSALNQMRGNDNILKLVTAERETLKTKTKDLTAERDQLLETVSKLNTTIQQKTCPAGWVKFQCSCYFLSSTEKTWSQSRDYCQSKGADLAIITSQEEMVFINGLIDGDKEVWIGLTDGGVEGEWKWVDGTPLTVSFWAKNQPNSHKGLDQDCVEFWHRDTGTGDWNDENCASDQYWICEKTYLEA